MIYCTRCVNPGNTKPYISFNEEGVCNWCTAHEEIFEIDYQKREYELNSILTEHAYTQQKKHNPYDCLVPVSGDNDSQYRVYIIKEKYGLNPLLVSFNHAFNSKVGIRNMKHMLEWSGCDLIRFTPSLESVKKISLMGLRKGGDITMHYHLGIPAFPEQIAVKYDIPLIVTGEPYYTYPGVHESVEVAKITGNSHGFVPEDFISEEYNVTWRDIAPYALPSNEDIEKLGLRYLFLPSHIYWDGRKNAEFLIDKGWFEPTVAHRARTFNTYEHTDDGVNQSHDYLKYLKFGYGRTTDHAGQEIRWGRMTRDQAVELVETMDSNEPDDLQLYLDFVGISKEEYINSVEDMRDPDMWQKVGGVWEVQDSVGRHATAGHNVWYENDFLLNDHRYYQSIRLCECEMKEDKLIIL